MQQRVASHPIRMASSSAFKVEAKAEPVVNHGPPGTHPDGLRSLWKTKGPMMVSSDDTEMAMQNTHLPAQSMQDATLVGSLGAGQLHYPCFDLDGIPIRIVESSTTGHCHMYIDRACSWESYKELLQALANCGVITHGYKEFCFKRGMSNLRLKPSKYAEIGKEEGYPDGWEGFAVRTPNEVTVNAQGMRFAPSDDYGMTDAAEMDDLDAMIGDLGKDEPF